MIDNYNKLFILVHNYGQPSNQKSGIKPQIYLYSPKSVHISPDKSGVNLRSAYYPRLIRWTSPVIGKLFYSIKKWLFYLCYIRKELLRNLFLLYFVNNFNSYIVFIKDLALVRNNYFSNILSPFSNYCDRRLICNK
jgi:hypothetical protein